MADKKIDPHELRRQRSQREQQRSAARRKSREANPNSDPASDEPADSPSTGKPKLKESDITGLKYFDKLAPLLERLRDDACQWDKADHCFAAVPDRELHFDQYCLLILLYLFNPVVTSLRGIQQASELDKVQKKLGCPRAALGSLSEAATVFDADRLKEIIAELGAELKPLARDARLQDIDQTLVLVDGSLIAALPSIMEASWRKQNKGSGLVKWRWAPTAGWSRLVCVKCSPHTSRGKYKGTSTGPDSDGVLRIATNLLDVPAEIISLLYAERWAIEIFFRFFKHLLGCRHLLSHKQNGIGIQTYCAIIACLLISLWTGRKPTKRTYEMICFYFLGVASEEELLAHITKLKRQDEAPSKKR